MRFKAAALLNTNQFKKYVLTLPTTVDSWSILARFLIQTGRSRLNTFQKQILVLEQDYTCLVAIKSQTFPFFTALLKHILLKIQVFSFLSIATRFLHSTSTFIQTPLNNFRQKTSNEKINHMRQKIIL